MATITVGELLVRCLKAEGVDLVTGIIDGAHIPIVVNTPKYGIRYINTRHEEAAVHIAEGYSRISKKPGVVLGNPACGTGNMLAGVVSAHGEGHPIIAIATTRARIKSDPNRGGTWQAADTESMARPITKYAATVRQWQRLPEMMRAAFRAAMTGRPGPAYLAIADELLLAEIDESDVPPIYPAERYRVTSMGAGDPASIERAAEILAGAERPYIHAGKGVLWSGASTELCALGDYLAAPMSTSLGARGVVPEDHPRYFATYDLEGLRAVRNEADVVLVAGARLGEYDTWGMPPIWGDPDKQTTIQIDADPMSIGLNRPVDLAIVADTKAALTALLEKVREKSEPRGDNPDIARYREQGMKTQVQGMEYLTQEPTSGVNPGQMVAAVRQFFPRNAITVLDGGNTTLLGVAYHPIFEPDSFLYSVKMGYLGTGLPFALGAKLAAPDRPVCLISGDGAFGFNAMEMETAARENIPIIAVVAVDDAWGMEKTAFVGQGFGPEDWKDRGIDVAPVSYDGLARDMGCHGERVESIDQMAPALERAAASGRPAVIHVAVDRELNTRPPGWEQFRAARAMQS
ncbi:MAG: thiamine pyrophosphate-binding protein [Deltaproteobacteria bacterium]|nr:MAG: thiamine pyrophosphate-binding protein [Deltaproteobacteria bacterium]